MMPEMDGVETMLAIRALGGKYAELKIIALTANAVKSAKDMLLKSGFDDFVAKPINTPELREVVRKHLPPDKYTVKTVSGDKTSRLAKEDSLLNKAIVTFVKENRDFCRRLNDSIDAKDYKTAHRLAHTIKSSAGYLGLKDLQAAALSLEHSLGADTPAYTSEQLEDINRYLDIALRNYEPIAAEAELEKAKKSGIEIGEAEKAEIFSELRKLLSKSDFAAVDYAEKLQNIAGMERLAELIDDYDFEGALNLLQTSEKEKNHG
jgi:HPt (histidine-containing phosphotransfer) domain-containing protein